MLLLGKYLVLSILFFFDIMEQKTIKFKYIFDENYNPVYVNGAQGGITPQGEIVANFYLERLALPNAQTQEVKADGTLGEAISSEPEDLNNSFVRFIKNGVVMNLQTAISISNWLNKHIDILQQLQKSQEKEKR